MIRSSYEGRRDMIRQAGLASCASIITLVATPAFSSETGFADMHSHRKEGRTVCMVDHYHYGSGSGKTKPAALAAAIQSWSSFTDFEYGSSWANFKRASSKAVSYSASSGGWTADVSARACK